MRTREAIVVRSAFKTLAIFSLGFLLMVFSVELLQPVTGIARLSSRQVIVLGTGFLVLVVILWSQWQSRVASLLSRKKWIEKRIANVDERLRSDARVVVIRELWVTALVALLPCLIPLLLSIGIVVKDSTSALVLPLLAFANTGIYAVFFRVLMTRSCVLQPGSLIHKGDKSTMRLPLPFQGKLFFKQTEHRSHGVVVAHGYSVTLVDKGGRNITLSCELPLSIPSRELNGRIDEGDILLWVLRFGMDPGLGEPVLHTIRHSGHTTGESLQSMNTQSP